MRTELEQTSDTVEQTFPETLRSTSVPEPKDEKINPKKAKKDLERSEEPPKITNFEGNKDSASDPKRTQVNKLSAMSKNTKEKQKNRRLSKPTSTIPQGSLSKMLNISPMYLLGMIGVIIAGISLWYQRKSYLQDTDESSEPPDLEKDPTESTSKSFVHTPSNLRGAPVPEAKKSKHPMDPFEWQRHHQQQGLLPNYPGSFEFD